MRQRHVASERINARAVLTAANITIGQDFFTLGSSQVCRLLEEADRVRYQKPRNANGSRGRYFYALLTRRANAKETA
jgi:hypothetical protein